MSDLKSFPKPIKFGALLGPSFIILALGLGSGEVILWPYLASNYGLGILWGAIIGITFQYFINMEIERYALVRGESVFVGINKVFKFAPYWLIFSTFVGFALPGIIVASATVFAHLLGFKTEWLAIILLLIIGLIISSGKSVYSTMEKITKIVLFAGVPFIFILALINSDLSVWNKVVGGLVGQGEGYYFLPEGILLATFFAAFAYSGAGGNLNLTQSVYIKEKGYGMGLYAQKIAGLFAQKSSDKEIKLEGERFAINEENLANFKKWWRNISLEHLLIFWFLGALSMTFLMILAYSTVYGLDGNQNSINFVIQEGLVISERFGSAIGSAFLVAVGVMLFQTQMGVMDSCSRIMSENMAIKLLEKSGKKTVNLSKIYHIFLWSLIIFGITVILFGFSEPKSLLVLAAIINAFAMFVHIGLVNWTNHKLLPKEVKPKLWRKAIIVIIFLFFGFFSMLTLWDKLFG